MLLCGVILSWCVHAYNTAQMLVSGGWWKAHTSRLVPYQANGTRVAFLLKAWLKITKSSSHRRWMTHPTSWQSLLWSMCTLRLGVLELLDTNVHFARPVPTEIRARRSVLCTRCKCLCSWRLLIMMSVSNSRKWHSYDTFLAADGNMCPHTGCKILTYHDLWHATFWILDPPSSWSICNCVSQSADK